MTLPNIHISFDEGISNSMVAYSRGADMKSNSIVSMINGAKIGQSYGRKGEVLHLSGIDSGAVVGDFAKNPIK